MEKFLRVILNRSVIVLLVSLIFISLPLQKLPLVYNVTCSKSVTVTYPELNFSSFFGGNERGEGGHGIAVSNDGHFYVTGATESNDFPTMNAYNSTYSGNADAIIAKFSSNTSLLWSTYFGGSDIDVGNDIVVASDDSSYITGFTRSSNFPTRNAFNNTYSGSDDVFLAKFSANGSLLWSTFLGGNEWDYGNSIAIANDGNCYVTGEIKSNNFPTKNAYDSTFNGGNFDAFVAKFAGNGTLLWSTYLGGNGNEAGEGLAVTADGSCYVTGRTFSIDFPTNNAYDNTLNGDWDVFITKFHANGTLLWSTFLGGSLWDDAWGIAVNGDGSCYITGYTVSDNFPTQDAYNNTYGGFGDAFLTKFTSNGSLLWSTFLGGNDSDRSYDVAVTNDGNCYVTGETGSKNFPNTYVYNASKESNYDVFITKFSPEGLLNWSTCLGGGNTDSGYSIAVTNDGSCFVTGNTYSADFPTYNAYDNILGATSDIFIMKFIDTPLPSTHNRAYYGFLIFVIIIPIIVLIVYKKRK